MPAPRKGELSWPNASALASRRIAISNWRASSGSWVMVPEVFITGSTEFLEQFLEHLLGLAPFRERLVAEADAVEHDVFGEFEQIFRHHVVALVDEGARPRRLHDGEAGTRRAAHFNRGVAARQ